HPSEPPLIPHPYLPFLGHVIGLFWHGASYFDRVNKSTKYPIYSLQTWTGRTVVIVEPKIAAVVQRASKNLTFYGMILEVTKRLVGFDEKTMDVIRWNINDEEGTHEGLMLESHDMVAGELEPGPSLNELSSLQLGIFSEMLNSFLPKGGTRENSVEMSLMTFVKRIFTTSNAHTIYGPQNPFVIHPSLVDKFWTYEAGMIAVMADLLPWLTARKPWLARRAINEALQEFVDKEYYKTASPMIRKRVAINLKHGLTNKMAGRAELILLFGIIGNAVPTTFWLLANIISRPELLAQLREETAAAITSSVDAISGEMVKTVDVNYLKTNCPLLVSTYRESLRLIGNLSSVRLVTNTHTISVPGHRPYLLKKGIMIQIASGVIHTTESVWGHDSKCFNPERFMSTTPPSTSASPSSPANSTPPIPTKTALPLPPSVPSAAFRAFGGGSVLCPGRHFALTEIVGFVTACIHMFDF
ncbi:cytochrome P450, partial [Amniculicola lignicola CBS 123094]